MKIPLPDRIKAVKRYQLEIIIEHWDGDPEMIAQTVEEELMDLLFKIQDRNELHADYKGGIVFATLFPLEEIEDEDAFSEFSLIPLTKEEDQLQLNKWKERGAV